MSKRYPSEFRRDAVALVRDGNETIPEVAERLGIAVQSLRNWLKEAEEIADGDNPDRDIDESEREELRRLRGRVRVLRRERDILKQALALMASSGGDDTATDIA
jgi:transposase